MSTETPAQRRTRLIEQYAGQLYPRICHCDATIDDAAKLADAVIAATPQEPEPNLEQQLKTARLEVESEMLRRAEPTRYPSEIETRLIELCELATHWLNYFHKPRALEMREKLAAIKRDLGLV